MATKSKPKKFELTIDQIEVGRDEDWGICLACGEIAEGGCEPDMEHGMCEMCGEQQLFGIEQAVIMGRINVSYADGSDRGL